MILTKASKELYEQYTDRMQKIADVRYSAAVLQWDQETYLPTKGADFRGRQLATLSEIAHEWTLFDVQARFADVVSLAEVLSHFQDSTMGG